MLAGKYLLLLLLYCYCVTTHDLSVYVTIHDLSVCVTIHDISVCVTRGHGWSHMASLCM